MFQTLKIWILLMLVSVVFIVAGPALGALFAVALVFYLAFCSKRQNRPGRLHEAAISVNEYFIVAVFTWLATNDEAAHLAAVAAGVTMASEQRAAALTYLNAMTVRLPEEQRTQILALRALVESKDWTMKDVWERKGLLQKADAEYYQAMSNRYGKADPDVFVKRHPEVSEFLGQIRPAVGNAPTILRRW